MSKSKHTKRIHERFDEEDQDNWNTNRDEHRRKLASKRLDRALKTKNLDDLMELDDEDF